MTMDISERKALRKKLLKGLYEHHFSGSKEAKAIKQEIEDIDVRQAYLYLEDKKLINTIDFNGPIYPAAEITIEGIDYYEAGETKTESQIKMENMYMFFTVRNILIENNFTTYEKFYGKYNELIRDSKVLSEEVKENLYQRK